MSALRLRETFNRLLNFQLGQYLKKGAAALLVSVSLVLPAAAHHNDNNDLNQRPSNTEYSQELRSIQDAFNRAVRDRRIILMDHDWIEINRALGDVRGNQELRNRYLAEYMTRYGGLHINADYFDGTTDGDMENPHSQMATARTDAGDALRVCTVYGAQGEQDGKTTVRDFVGLSRIVHGDALYNAPVALDIDAEQFKQFVNYHEIGHCMDDWFVTTMNQVPGNDLLKFLLLYHRAESFADVYGTLMMAREQGVTDIAEKVANIRLVGMATQGPIQARWMSPQSVSRYGSLIYATHRSVRAAQDYIDQNGVAALKGMSYQQVAQLARDIVDKNALGGQDFDALMYLYMSKFNTAQWDKLKDTDPAVADRYDEMKALRAEVEKSLREVFDLSHLQPGQDALSAIPYGGTAAAFVAELQSRVPNQAAIDAKAQALADDLYNQAGGSHATEASLLQVFTQQKDLWRQTLENGTAAERAQAMENMALGGKALWLAGHKVRGTDPAAPPAWAPPSPPIIPPAGSANDNVPVAPPPAIVLR